MSVEITEKFFSDAAGWEAMKCARAFLAQGQVVSSNWSPPLLRGVVRVGDIFFRASLVIKDEVDIENLCTCREARESGRICAHVVAVGLHWLTASFGQIDNGETTMAERNAGVAVDPGTAAIRSAMSEGCRHRLDRREPARIGRTRSEEDADDAAHAVSSKLGTWIPYGSHPPPPSKERMRTRRLDGG